MNGISKEAEISIAASSMFPGFRFSPTDEELILYYLKKKLDGFDKCVEVIAEVDICKFEPWDLPAKAIIQSDQEWFFFSPRGKKYPNGSQSKRATEIGYWKATGKERAVKSGQNLIGTKRTLVFHIGRAPKGERTEWIMHEYCMAGKGQAISLVSSFYFDFDWSTPVDKDALVVCRLRRKVDFQPIDGVDGEISSGGKPLSMIDSSVGTSGGGGGDKIPECSLKKCSSSNDSHSVEQLDSASESDRKFRDEIMQPESNSHSKNANYEDDLFADILNDNIIQLDECPPSSTPELQQTTTTSTTVSIVPRTYSRAGQPITSPVIPSQGTANRRIRLRKLRRLSSGKNVLSPKKRSMGMRKTNKLYVVVIAMTLVVLLVSLGASWCVLSPVIRSR